MFSQDDIRFHIVASFPRIAVEERIPIVDDLLHDTPFITFRQYHKERGSWKPLMPPELLTSSMRRRIDVAMGLQTDTRSSRAAPPPLVTDTGDAWRHFLKARLSAFSNVPWTDNNRSGDADLTFAAEMSAKHFDHLGEHRKFVQRQFRRLQRRVEPLNRYILSHQLPHVAAVAGSMNVVMIAILIMLSGWPDKHLPMRFVTGFDVLGCMESSGLFAPCEAEPVTSKRMLCEEHEDKLRGWVSRMTAEDSAVALRACRTDESRGLASRVMSKAEVDRRFGRYNWASCPRFVITQGTGKKRPIDDGFKGGVSAATSYQEKLGLCSATQTASSARALQAAFARRYDGEAFPGIEAGGDDLPDAYRRIPASTGDLNVNLVAIHIDGHWRFQIVYGLLF